MTALTTAEARYQQACDRARHVARLLPYGRASHADLRAARQERDAAWQDVRAARGEGR